MAENFGIPHADGPAPVQDRKGGRPAFRFNLKLVLAVGLATATLAGGIVVLFLFSQRRDPARFETLGEAAFAAGNYKDALPNYGRALRLAQKPEVKIRLMRRIVDSLGRLPAASNSDAYLYYRHILSFLEEIALLNPSDTKSSQQLLDAYFQMAVGAGVNESWEELRTKAQKLVAAAPSNPVALKYEGIANVVWMSRFTMDDRARQAVREHLEKSRAAMPDDGKLAFYLATWHVSEARIRLELANRQEAVKQLAAAEALIGDFVDKHPADLDARVDQIRVLLDAGAMLAVPQAAERPEYWKRAVKLLADLEKRMLTEDHPDQARDVAVLLRTSDGSPLTLADGTNTTNGNERAVAVLRNVLKNHPDRQDALYDIGCVFRFTKRQGGAVEAFSKAAAERPPAVGPSIQKQRNLQALALYEWIGILLDQYDGETAVAPKRALLAETKTCVKRFQELVSSTPALDMIEGRVALAEGKQWEALDKLDAADARMNHRNPDAAYLAGDILARLGQHAAALQRYEAVFAMPESPGPLRIKTAKAMIRPLLRMMRLDQAAQIAETLRKINPDDHEADLFMSETLMERARAFGTLQGQGDIQLLWQAVRLAKPLADQGNSEARKQLAQLCLRLGEINQARSAFVDYVRGNPSDKEALCTLVALELRLGLVDSAVQRIRGVLESIPPNRAATLLQEGLAAQSGPLYANLPALLLIALERAPVKRELQLADFAMQANLPTEARNAIARAKEADPRDPQLLRFLFASAMAGRDFEAAKAVIGEAEAAAMDETEVMVFNAQLSLGRGDAKAALGILRDVTQKRRLFSDGWLLLGLANRLAGNPQDARMDFQKSADLKPDNLQALQEMFRSCDEAREYPTALGYLRQIILYQPENPVALDNFLVYLSLHGDKDEALRLRQQVAVYQPGNRYNRSVLARLCVEAGKFDQAEAELRQLLEQSPDDRENVLTSAMLDLARKHPEDGRRKLEDYVRRIGGKAAVEDWLVLAHYLRQMDAAPDAILNAYGKAQSLQDQRTMPVTLEVAAWQASRNAFAEALALYREYRDKTRNYAVSDAIIGLLMRRNQYDEAERELAAWRKATAPKRESRQAVIAARILAEHGKIREAEEELNTALNSFPNDPALYLTRAEIFFDRREGKIQARVKSDLEKTIAMLPSVPRPREMLQEWFRRETRMPEAVEQLTRLIDLRPDVPSYRLQLAQIYLQQQKTDALERLLKDSVEKADAPAWHLMLASLHRQRGRTDDAIREFAAAYDMQKKPAAECVALYAGALVDAKQPEKALAVIGKQPELLQSLPQLNAIQGRAFAATGKDYSAETSYTAAIGLAEDSEPAMEAVVEQLQAVETDAAILRRLEHAKRSRPVNALDIAISRLLGRMGRMEESQAVLESVAARLPKDDTTLQPAVFWLLGTSYHTTKQYGKARVAYESLLRLQPNHMAALNNLAILLADEMNMPQEALPLATKAASIWQMNDADRANVLDTLGHIQFLAGKLPESALTFQRSLELTDCSGTRIHLAETLIKQMRIVEARGELQRAQQLAAKEKAGKDTVQKIVSLLASLETPGREARPGRSGSLRLDDSEFKRPAAQDKADAAAAKNKGAS